jgi:predicted kinase
VGAVDTPTDQDLRDRTGARGLDQRLEHLDHRHPASPRYPDRPPPDAGGAADRVRPLTDAEHADHVAEVRGHLADAHAAGLATDVQHTIDPRGEVWSRARRALHDAILEELYAANSDVPCDRKAIIAGGLPGAGKTTILEQFAGIELGQYVMVNPDRVKTELIRRGLVPNIDGLSPMEASVLVHEEASHIAKRLAHRAQADGKNIIWDVTMSSSASTDQRIGSLRESGYTRIDGVFVDIPVDVSLTRADSRHRQAHDEYRDGRGLGGRYVPPETILNYADREWGSQNRRNFESLKSGFDGWSRYDNSVDGRDPILAESYSSADRQRSI